MPSNPNRGVIAMAYEIFEQNKGALAPLLMALIGATLLAYLLPRIAQFMKESTKDAAWIAKYKEIRLPLMFSIIIYGGVELSFDIVIDPEALGISPSQSLY